MYAVDSGKLATNTDCVKQKVEYKEWTQLGLKIGLAQKQAYIHSTGKTASLNDFICFGMEQHKENTVQRRQRASAPSTFSISYGIRCYFNTS